MSNVTFSFNLDPVVSAASQRTSPVSAQSNAAIGAQFEAAQASSFTGQSSMAVSSPACDASNCYVAHGDGPGVTTLSIGEEDGGSGDFLSLPFVDGVQMAEPPATSFASAGEYDISTLAIGEEDGGGVSSYAEIGAPEPSYAQPAVETNTYGQFAFAPIETMPVPKPMAVAPTQSVEMASSQSTLQPLETAPIAAAPSFIEPRMKPASIASFSAPMPEIKPSSAIAEGVFAGGDAAAMPSAPVMAAPSGGENVVSVGDYDSYIASLGGGDGATAPAATGGDTGTVPTASVEPVTYVPPPAAPEKAERVTVTYQPAQPAAADSLTTIGSTGQPIQEITPDVSASSPEPVYIMQGTATPEPAAINGSQTNAVSDVEMIESTSSQVTPASFTTTGPATLSPIQTTPIPAVGTDGVAMQEAASVAPTSTFATIEAPVPSGKPEGIAGDQPQLSADDLRITTLALGEEDGGGG